LKRHHVHIIHIILAQSAFGTMSSSSPSPHSSTKGSTTLTALNNLTEVSAPPLVLPNYHDNTNGGNEKRRSKDHSASNADVVAANNSASRNEEVKLTEKDVAQEEESARPSQSAPYSAFSQRQKWTIVGLSSLAAIFGPLSSNIYVPAIPAVVKDFNTTTQRIDLTLTIYL
jgi:hypothetical protein